MGTGFSKKKKEAKMLQQQLAKMQDNMKSTEVHGQAGNGLVQLVITGDYAIKSLKINPQCVDPEDVEGLEDLVKAAFKDALDKLQQQNPSSGGSSLPDLGGLDLSALGL